MENIRDENGIIKVKINNEDEFRTLYHSVNVKNKEYLLYYLDNKGEKTYIYDKEKIRQILDFIKGIELWKNI